MFNTAEPKWIGKSKTFLGIAFATAVQMAPLLGLTFSADDAAMVGDIADKLLTGIGLAFALYGRFNAKQTVMLL